MARNEGTETTKEQRFFEVFDLNQSGDKPRVHDVITKLVKAQDGTVLSAETVSYELYSRKGQKMPSEHALKFLCDPQFKVVNPEGNRIQPIAKFDPSKPITKLADDEIVVKINELSRESLLRRVKVLPGSEDVRGDAGVEELAAFLVAWNQQKRGMTDGERQLAERIASGDTLAGDMPKEMLDKMFPASETVRKAA